MGRSRPAPVRPLAYVGALGSRRTQTRRIRDLPEADVSPDALAALRTPPGLDRGATTPQETAVSLAAELMAVRSGRSLSVLDGPVHAARNAGLTAAGDRCGAGTDPVR
ncbi:XdhC family protein [Streptomyces sp. NPDC028722]|uniref:XdhC family protein n=1 Tax=Streptomyces sp. NPDC028722 TaxID=3155016 RepID=UPI0033F9F990